MGKNSESQSAQPRINRGALEAEILWLTNANDGNGLARPKISYEWCDDFKSWMSADILDLK